MRDMFAVAIAAILGAALPVRAECPLDKIDAALASSTQGLKTLERDVSDVQSTEGGVWQIYREKDGRVHSIIRIDAGEMGRNDTRLSMVNRNIYGISSTRIDYLRHAFIEDAGPNAEARRTTTNYYFCDGKQYLPPDGMSLLDGETYKADGLDLQKMMVLHKDVADFTKGLAK